MAIMPQDPRLLDMTPDGRFTPPRRSPLGPRIVAGAVILAVVATALAVAAFALWIALLLVPVAIGAAVVAYLMIRFRIWQARRRAGSFGGGRDVFRP